MEQGKLFNLGDNNFRNHKTNDKCLLYNETRTRKQWCKERMQTGRRVESKCTLTGWVRRERKNVCKLRCELSKEHERRMQDVGSLEVWSVCLVLVLVNADVQCEREEARLATETV